MIIVKMPPFSGLIWQLSYYRSLGSPNPHTSKPPEEMIRASSLQQGRQASNLVDLWGGRFSKFSHGLMQPDHHGTSWNIGQGCPNASSKRWFDSATILVYHKGSEKMPAPHAVFFNLNFKSLPKKKTTPSEKLIIYETKTSFMGNLSPLPPMSPPSRK